MLILLLTLLAPTPPDRPPESPAGVWIVDGTEWAGYTLCLSPGGGYSALSREFGTLFVGDWSATPGGALVVRERPVRWCDEDGPVYGPWTRYEFPGLRVRGGRLTAGRLAATRAE